MIINIKDCILYLFYAKKIKYTKNVLKKEYKDLIKKYEKSKIVSYESIFVLNYLLYCTLLNYKFSLDYKYKLTNRIILIVTKKINHITFSEFKNLGEENKDDLLICKNIILKENGYYKDLWTKIIKSQIDRP